MQATSSPTTERCPVCGGDAAHTQTVLRAGAVASCRACGSWYRVPRPGLAELLQIYDKDYYNAWGLDGDETIARKTKEATFAPVLDRIARLLPPDLARPKILDVGAATGILLDVAKARGWEPYGLELNPYSGKVLRERFGDDRIFQGELTACTFPPASFDVVTMTDLIEHVLDVPGTLRAAAKLLRPGGIICITTPRIDSLTRRAMGKNWLHFKLEHIQYFSLAGMRRALSESGFSEIHSRTAVKRLTQDYLYTQLCTYPHWLLTPMIRVAHAISPGAIRRIPISYRCGEMLILARRA